jgi:twitching motility protein PilT
VSRFRCNAYRQRGTLAAICRIVNFELPNPKDMLIPDIVMNLCSLRSGMILVTGPAGSGKSTTLACMVNRINETRSNHIVTIEDPIEYLHKHKKSLVSQREVPNDASTFSRALRAALRQAPDVVMLGEMRDLDTIRTAITAAETGHLLLSSLHTIGAAKTVDRIIDTFPAEQQAQIRIQLSMVLRAVVSQRLVPDIDGGRLPVFEVMSVNPAIQNMIRDGRTHQIDNVIYGGSDKNMLSMDNELTRLFKAGRISRDTALSYAANPETLSKRI